MARVYLSLGSNLEPHRHLPAAIAELRAHFGELAVSPAYRSASVGFDGGEFVNLAVGLDTDLPPAVLNEWLHALEDRHGRRRDVPGFRHPVSGQSMAELWAAFPPQREPLRVEPLQVEPPAG